MRRLNVFPSMTEGFRATLDTVPPDSRCGVTRWASWMTIWPLLLAMWLPTMSHSRVMAQEQLQDAPGSTPPMAGTTDPVVVVSIGSINQLTQDINYLSGAIGTPQMGFTFAMMAGTFAQGIDTSQPIGVVVPLVNGAPEPMALIPAANVKSVLKTLEAQTGPADELDDGTLVIAIGANTIFIRQVGNWAVLARNSSVLDSAPADPGALLGEMGIDYDVAVKLDVQKIPAATRDALIGQLRQGFEQAISRQQGGGDETALEYAEQSLAQLEQVISQTDDLMIGLDIDSTNRRVLMDFSVSAVPDSPLAKIYNGQKPIESSFDMVVRDDVAGFVHAAASIGPETIEQSKNSVQGLSMMAEQALGQWVQLSESDLEDASEMIGRLIELVVESYGEGKLDGGALLLADREELQFVMGAFVADGDKAAQIVKDIAAKVEGRGDAPRFEFDRDTYKGVKLHLVEADVPDSEDEARKVFGETVRVHVGTGPKAVYLGLGDTSVPLMMEMIDGASEPGPVATDGVIATSQFNLMPILKFAQSIESQDSIASMLDALARADDLGELKLVASAIDRGQETRLIFGDGLIRAIGAAYRQAQIDRMQNAEF